MACWAKRATVADPDFRKLCQQALDALDTCGTGGYVDIDGDYQKTYRFNAAMVFAARDALTSALNDANGVKPCATEQDCEQQPWCRINGKCQRVPVASPLLAAAKAAETVLSAMSPPTNKRDLPEVVAVLAQLRAAIVGVPGRVEGKAE